MDFSLTEHEKLVDIVSHSSVQLAFKNIPFVQFWFNINKECAVASEKIIKIPSFPTTYLCETRFSLYISNTMHCDRLNAIQKYTV